MIITNSIVQRWFVYFFLNNNNNNTKTIIIDIFSQILINDIQFEDISKTNPERTILGCISVRRDF